MPKFMTYQRPAPVGRQPQAGKPGFAYGKPGHQAPRPAPEASQPAPDIKLPRLPLPKGN